MTEQFNNSNIQVAEPATNNDLSGAKISYFDNPVLEQRKMEMLLVGCVPLVIMPAFAFVTGVTLYEAHELYEAIPSPQNAEELANQKAMLGVIAVGSGLMLAAGASYVYSDLPKHVMNEVKIKYDAFSNNVNEIRDNITNKIVDNELVQKITSHSTESLQESIQAEIIGREPSKGYNFKSAIKETAKIGAYVMGCVFTGATSIAFGSELIESIKTHSNSGNYDAFAVMDDLTLGAFTLGAGASALLLGAETFVQAKLADKTVATMKKFGSDVYNAVQNKVEDMMSLDYSGLEQDIQNRL